MEEGRLREEEELQRQEMEYLRAELEWQEAESERKEKERKKHEKRTSKTADDKEEGAKIKATEDEMLKALEQEEARREAEKEQRTIEKASASHGSRADQLFDALEEACEKEPPEAEPTRRTGDWLSRALVALGDDDGEESSDEEREDEDETSPAPNIVNDLQLLHLTEALMEKIELLHGDEEDG